MRPNITISFPSPYLTIEAFSQHSGLSKSTIRDMIADGRLPVRKKEINMKRGKVLINLSALYSESLTDCNVSFQ